MQHLAQGGTELSEDPARDEELRVYLGAGFERSALPMLVLDDAQQIRRANTAAAVMLGADDLAGRSVLDFRPDDTDPGTDPQSVVLLAAGTDGCERETVVLSDSGRRLRVTMQVDAITLLSGERLFLVQLRDNTMAVAHETAWAQSELQFRQLVSNLPGMSVLMFDHDLRLIESGGQLLDNGHDETGATAGQLLTDVVPAPVLALLEGPYRAAAAGQEADFDYDSPIDGRQFRIRLRPVTGTDGTIIGGLALTEDVTAHRARQTLLEHIQQLSNVGTISFDRTGGWLIDNEMYTLLGLDPGENLLRAMEGSLFPEDLRPTREAYRGVLASGGRTTLQYGFTHRKTGELRHVSARIRATVDADGTLLRVIATHADVTDVVEAQSAKVRTAAARTILLRSVSDALANAPGSVRDMMQSIVDAATTALGDGTLLRVFTADGDAVEADLVCNRDALIDDAVTACLRESGDGTGPAAAEASGVAGDLWSSIGNAEWRNDFQRHMGHPVDPDIQHIVSAAVRHDGLVLGYLRVYRLDRNKPYQIGDDDLIQILADRIGSVITDGRVRELLERQRTEHQAIAQRLQDLTREQRELLEQLAGVEERERTLLAEAIHDGPMQLVVAVMMRLENSSMHRRVVDDVEMELLIVTLETSIQRLRTLIIALTSPDLSAGLGMALRRLAEGIFLGTATEITVLGAAHVNLTPLSKGNAHRILREALVNARKHARARHVVLELTERGGWVTARLTDDGIGAASLDAGPGHLGMATMRARADAEGGRLEVTSAPGAGTTVVLTLPTAPVAHRHIHSPEEGPRAATAGPTAAELNT